jgi:hypothetical protein
MFLKIDTSITIHIQGGGGNTLSKSQKEEDEKSLLRKDIIPLMLKGDAIDAQWGFDPK